MRRRRDHWFRSSISLVLAISLLAGCGGGSNGGGGGGGAVSTPESGGAQGGSSANGPQKGGVLRVAVIGEPPNLDMHTTTATITFEIGWHMFETLYTYTASYGIQPMLAAEMPEINDGGKQYVIKLRQGVPFHNGKEMTSEDVVASMQRWKNLAQNAQSAFAGLNAIKAVDPYTLEVSFDQPNGTLLVAMATPGNGLAIYPKEIAEQFPDKPITEYVGTGPYEFVEHVTDRYIRMKRFEQYAARSEESDGPGGKKQAYVDEIRFIPVPDVNTRLSGLESGDYDVAAVLSGSQYETVRGNPDLQAILVKPISHLNVSFNMKKGPFTNKLIRQAAQAAMDAEAIMAAGFGHPDLYRLDPGLMQQEQTEWYTDAGKELYNQHNSEKAKQLLGQAGYKGEKIRFLATKEYDYNYKSALVYSEQLKAAGFNVELVISDWATLIQNRAKEDAWEIFSTGISVKNSPLMLASMGDKWFGWWENEERNRLVSEIAGELDTKRAAESWARLQQLYYQEAPSVKVGDYFSLRAARKEVGNVPTMGEYYFWNTYLGVD